MKLSQAGEEALVKREGFSLVAYKDTKGIVTIGVGHTGTDVHMGDIWTHERVEEVFDADVQWAVDTVNTIVMPLNQNMFDALVSFTFNVGKYAFLLSTMRRLLDLGFYADAANEFDKWNKPPEIITRRASEKAQFLAPVA